jgi:hypothetical protein
MFYTPSNFKPNVGKARPVDTYSEIPESMDVYQRTEAQFLPDGKTLEELTPEELEHMQFQYRFDPYKPGQYQSITWIRVYKEHGL